jgi:hypothetical protein
VESGTALLEGWGGYSMGYVQSVGNAYREYNGISGWTNIGRNYNSGSYKTAMYKVHSSGAKGVIFTYDPTYLNDLGLDIFDRILRFMSDQPMPHLVVPESEFAILINSPDYQTPTLTSRETWVRDELISLGYTSISYIPFKEVRRADLSHVRFVIVTGYTNDYNPGSSIYDAILSQGIGLILLYNAGELYGGSWSSWDHPQYRQLYVESGTAFLEGWGGYSMGYIQGSNNAYREYNGISGWTNIGRNYNSGSYKTAMYKVHSSGAKGAMFTYDPNYFTNLGDEIFERIIRYVSGQPMLYITIPDNEIAFIISSTDSSTPTLTPRETSVRDRLLTLGYTDIFYISMRDAKAADYSNARFIVVSEYSSSYNIGGTFLNNLISSGKGAALIYEAGKAYTTSGWWAYDHTNARELTVTSATAFLTDWSGFSGTVQSSNVPSSQRYNYIPSGWSHIGRQNYDSNYKTAMYKISSGGRGGMFTYDPQYYNGAGAAIFEDLIEWIDGADNAGIQITNVDLQLSDVWHEPLAPGNGGDVVLYANVTNLGTQVRGKAFVSFYIDDLFIGSVSTACPTGGNTSTVSLSWTAIQGSHTLLAVVDKDNLISETDESNNEASVIFGVGLPDLSVTALDVTHPTNLKVGDSITINATITNVASFNALKTFYYNLYLDGVLIEVGSINGLEAGNSTNISIVWAATYGLHSFEFVVDLYDNVLEFNETNNSKFVSLPFVSMPFADGPDLIIENIEISPEGMHDGEYGVLNATVRNAGNEDINEWFYVVFLKDGRIISSRLVIARLAAGETVNFSYPFITRLGNHDYGMMADVDFRILETNEMNNTGYLNVNFPAHEFMTFPVKKGTLINFTVQSQNYSSSSGDAYMKLYDPNGNIVTAYYEDNVNEWGIRTITYLADINGTWQLEIWYQYSWWEFKTTYNAIDPADDTLKNYEHYGRTGSEYGILEYLPEVEDEITQYFRYDSHISVKKGTTVTITVTGSGYSHYDYDAFIRLVDPDDLICAAWRQDRVTDWGTRTIQYILDLNGTWDIDLWYDSWFWHYNITIALQDPDTGFVTYYYHEGTAGNQVSGSEHRHYYLDVVDTAVDYFRYNSTIDVKEGSTLIVSIESLGYSDSVNDAMVRVYDSEDNIINAYYAVDVGNWGTRNLTVPIDIDGVWYIDVWYEGWIWNYNITVTYIDPYNVQRIVSHEGYTGTQASYNNRYYLNVSDTKEDVFRFNSKFGVEIGTIIEVTITSLSYSGSSSDAYVYLKNAQGLIVAAFFEDNVNEWGERILRYIVDDPGNWDLGIWYEHYVWSYELSIKVIDNETGETRYYNTTGVSGSSVGSYKRYYPIVSTSNETFFKYNSEIQAQKGMVLKIWVESLDWTNGGGDGFFRLVDPNGNLFANTYMSSISSFGSRKYKVLLDKDGIYSLMFGYQYETWSYYIRMELIDPNTFESQIFEHYGTVGSSGSGRFTGYSVEVAMGLVSEDITIIQGDIQTKDSLLEGWVYCVFL